MSIKPLDLQVNVNSTIELSKTEGAKLARLDSDQRYLDEKLNKQYESASRRITEMSNSEASSKTDNERINNHLDDSNKKQQKHKKNKKQKDQIQSTFMDTKENLKSKRVDFLV